MEKKTPELRYPIKGSFMNIDNDLFWYIRTSYPDGLADAGAKFDEYVDGYLGHGISDMVFCILTQSSVIPSKHIGFIRDNYFRTEEGGIPVDYTKPPIADLLLPYVETYEQLADPYARMMDRCKKNGLGVWLSYRVNDCHESHRPTSHLRSDELYYEGKRRGLFVGDHVAGEYFGECLSYSSSYVREKMLAYIDESLGKYDVDGIELDYLREMICFDYENEPRAREIMNGFMRSVKGIVDRYSRERGKEIRILVRVVRSLSYNLIFGFDIETWMKEGLVDIVSPCSRWQCTDTDMPISEWKNVTSRYGVALLAGSEFYLLPKIKFNHETMRAYTRQYLEDGADGIYLYNFYRESALPSSTPLDAVTAPEGSNTRRFALLDREKLAIWDAASEPMDAHGARRYVMTYAEPSVTPKGAQPYKPLPLRLHGKTTLEKLTGNIEGGEVYLYLGIKADAEPPRVVFDGTPATFIGRTADAYPLVAPCDGKPSPELCDASYCSYSVTPKSTNRRSISLEGDAEIVYLEIKVNS